MQDGQSIVVGSVLGIVGALPSVFLLELALRNDRRASVPVGLASIMLSFAMLTAAIFAVWLTSREQVLAFGVAEVASFLLLWSVEAWRAWRDAQR